MISGKVTQYKLLWIGNRIGLIGVNIILTEKWVDKVIDISTGSDRMIVIKLLVRGIIISFISVYASQYGPENASRLIEKGMSRESIS